MEIARSDDNKTVRAVIEIRGSKMGKRNRQAMSVGNHDTVEKQQPDETVARTEKGRREVLYMAMVLILILGTGIVVYAFNFESLNALFKSDYFNNMVRISLALLILAFIGYLAIREKSYSKQSQQIFSDLNNTTRDLQVRLGELTSLLELSKLVAIADDLHCRLENKMPHMKGHWKRVSFYAVETARRMELDEDYIRLIERAADLMDIGMLQVAGSLSQDAYKASEMLPADKEMIKRHPVVGADMLAAIRPNWELIPLVRGHHEWWNGMGYPDGLKGESIPLGARVLSVADSFAAMTSWRSYREDLEPRDALKEIEAYGGVQYDPKVTLAFLAVMTPRIFGIGGEGHEDAELILLKEIGGSGGKMDARRNPQII